MRNWRRIGTVAPEEVSYECSRKSALPPLYASNVDQQSIFDDFMNHFLHRKAKTESAKYSNETHQWLSYIVEYVWSDGALFVLQKAGECSIFSMNYKLILDNSVPEILSSNFIMQNQFQLYKFINLGMSAKLRQFLVLCKLSHGVISDSTLLRNLRNYILSNLCS